MSIDEREWQAQEQALIDSRAGRPLERGDAGYRRIADALRVAPPPQLPADFTAMLAAQAAKPAAIAAIDTRLEALLTMLMTGLLVLAGLACAWVYGSDWLSPVQSLVARSPTMPLRLALTIAGCAALSWALNGWRVRGMQQR